MSALLLLGLIAVTAWWVADVDAELMDDIDPGRRRPPSKGRTR